MEKELFTLLRLGLAITSTEEENLSDFIMLKAEQWHRIGNLARKQGVLGIMLDGVDWLETTRYGLTRELKATQKLEWIGEVLQTEQRNSLQVVVMNDLAGKWNQQGFRVMVMKGQANGVFYPKPDHRSPGDIDCYLFENYECGNEIARQEGANVDESWYKHSVINYKSETFENHQYFVYTREGKRGKRLNEELVEVLRDYDSWFTDERAKLTQYVYMPPMQWTAMFLTYHACAHFISEGLRLKQLLDWAMLLKNHQNDIDWPTFYDFCKRYHLRRFADAATAISMEYLGIEITNSAITIISPYAERILKDALYNDDYVFSSGEGAWKNRWHLVRNLFRYQWKYEEIYQESVWRQLWYYVVGFLFKTE